MKHITTTPPATEPVSLAEMRLHLGIVQATDTARDSVISARIIAAREFVESYTSLKLITQTVTVYADNFPWSNYDSYCIRLLAPAQSVTEISYLDSSGTRQIMDSADYQISSINAEVYPGYGTTWPDCREQRESIQVKYIAGYGNAAAVPQSIKEALMFIVSQWEVFQSSIEGVVRPFTIPNAAKELLNPYVDWREIF